MNSLSVLSLKILNYKLYLAHYCNIFLTTCTTYLSISFSNPCSTFLAVYWLDKIFTLCCLLV